VKTLLTNKTHFVGHVLIHLLPYSTWNYCATCLKTVSSTNSWQ